MIAVNLAYKRLAPCLVMLLMLTTEKVCSQSTSLNARDSSQMMTEDGQGGYILEDFIVERTVDLKGVTIENDGSYSLIDFRPAIVFAAMNSGAGSAINFQLSFARHSTVLTADGQQELENIARAMKLIGKDVAFQIYIHRYANQDPKGRKSLTKNRANVVTNLLKMSHGIASEISLDFKSAPTLKKTKHVESTKLDYLGVTVVNEGRIEFFSPE